jgi:pimeloyl-ACP methyl ester carboxylesterase
VSADGTEIAGRVQGDGPALVLVHGGIGDGEIAWDAMLPHLIDRFTCYLPSTRGRGLSGDNPDHSPPRLEDDVTAFVGSIGEPVYLAGWSGSGAWVLGTAAIATDLIAWLQLLALDGDLARAEPKLLRFRMLHVAARLTFQRIMIIPAPT